VAVQGATEFLACDISAEGLRMAHGNVRALAPGARLRPFLGTHHEALAALKRLPGRTLLCLLGSSLGNLPAGEAVDLLARAREAIGAHGSLLLGVDGPGEPRALRRAYDDAAGVTAAFTRNVLARCNRELGADFDPRAFRHVIRWDAAAGDLLVWLQSLRRQEVRVASLGLRLAFARGERLHVETSAKYDLERIDGLFARAGLARTQTHRRGRYAIHLARAARTGASA
jgi:L-histidine N-alpha-methyltransferase